MSNGRKRREINTDNRNGERGLWVAVVLQAIEDATANGKAHSLARQQARSWFRRGNPDFIEVCNLAGLDPEATYEKAIAAIERHDARGDNSIPRKQGAPLRIYTLNGVSKTIAEWSEQSGIPTTIIRNRLTNGWTLNDALNRKVEPKRGVTYTVNGETRTLPEWAKALGVPTSTLTARLGSGRTPEEAFTRDFKRMPRSVPPVGRRKAKPHTLNGVSKTIAQWAASHGLKEHTLAQRLRDGMTLADALSVPVRQRVAKATVPISPDQPPKQPKPRPGVVFDFGAFEGTGAGSTAQETPNLEFSKEAAE
ncbi:hypothetical protein DFR48_102292 [Ciceribacter lividus]|uniref:Uncharacterized protein n=1 Tax=Ciceribacter lividus TaxID=1197950 RepID=A0A6I7HSB3_9HYPH|nr:hypothetical protein [Ciceribacter lividus]RCW27806.1 hypothetical protein DFR48_102292 [Ciceribacter lividus]